MKKHSYIGAKNYGNSSDNKFVDHDLFIIDECSMITDSDFTDTARFAAKYHKILLFIGDINQIPHPSQKYEIVDGLLTKKDSLAFSIKNRFKLTKIMRTGKYNALIDIYDSIRSNMSEDLPYERETKIIFDVHLINIFHEI